MSGHPPPAAAIGTRLYGTAAPGLAAGTPLSPGEFGRRQLERVVVRVVPEAPRVISDPVWAAPTLLEMAWEIVRLREFPELPSRLNCLFFWMDEGAARRFHSNRPWPAELYEVEVVECARICLADMNLISYFEVNESAASMMERARRYWAGELPVPPGVPPEVLLEGTVRVVRSLAGPRDPAPGAG
jgi:hypothetical protein